MRTDVTTFIEIKLTKYYVEIICYSAFFLIIYFSEVHSSFKLTILAITAEVIDYACSNNTV